MANSIKMKEEVKKINFMGKLHCQTVYHCIVEKDRGECCVNRKADVSQVT